MRRAAVERQGRKPQEYANISRISDEVFRQTGKQKFQELIWGEIVYYTYLFGKLEAAISLEFFIGLIVIIVICKILGISNVAMITAALAVIAVLIILMAALFAFFCVNLLFSKPQKAVFLHEYKPANSRFSVACYLCDGKEIRCIFPMESAMKSRLYSSDKSSFVMYSRLLNRVYDICAILTCILGLAFSGSATFFIIKFLCS